MVFNPLGIQQDGIFIEGQGTDYSIDILMESKGSIQDWGWSVEVRIPFKSLRYRVGPGRRWGKNFARRIHRFNQENDQWMPDDRNVSGTLIKHGWITGIEGITLSGSLSAVVSTTISEAGKRARTIPPSLLTPSSLDSGHFVNMSVKGELGATIKYAITPDLTFDVAINPDFAEIEADAPVVTTNVRFSIFYEEKRPFFLEGIDILKTPNRLFHSRTIVDPDLALKLSGKVGRTSLGMLFAIDSYCRRFAAETMKQIERDYIDTHRIAFVFHDLPIESSHPYAVKASVAAQCAGKQGRLWEMNHRLLADPMAIKPDDLVSNAQALKLDMSKFQRCLEDSGSEALVRQRVRDAAAVGIDSTPTFLVGIRKPGSGTITALRMIEGGYPYDVFKATLETLIAATHD